MSDPDRPPLFPPAALALDPYREWDAAYVLGALSPADRREFEGHLSTCTGCRAGLAEVAGMPALLAQMSAEDVVLEGDPGDPPTVHLPRRAENSVPYLVRLDRRRRRLTRGVVALAVACLLLAGLVGLAAVRGTFDLSRPAAGGPFRLAFSPVVPSEITAVVDVVPVAAGTELRVECQYASADATVGYQGHDYAIVVTDTSGHTTSVKTWTARTNAVMHPSGLAPLPVSKISSVEIRSADSSQTLLRARVS